MRRKEAFGCSGNETILRYHKFNHKILVLPRFLKITTKHGGVNFYRVWKRRLKIWRNLEVFRRGSVIFLREFHLKFSLSVEKIQQTTRQIPFVWLNRKHCWSANVSENQHRSHVPVNFSSSTFHAREERFHFRYAILSWQLAHPKCSHLPCAKELGAGILVARVLQFRHAECFLQVGVAILRGTVALRHRLFAYVFSNSKLERILF